MVDYDEIMRERESYRLEAPAIAGEANRKARELLQECKKRDAGKVTVPHPQLPNTRLVVSREKAEKLTQKIKWKDG